MPQETGAADSTALALYDQHGVTVTTLANGLRTVIKEDHRSPVAICHVWVRVGSNREPDHLRGWSHGIEHMLFKGTARRGERDFAREVALAGGTTNAGTGYETTSYHVLVPRENLDQACDILADAIFHSAFAPASLDAERQVLIHENHMYDDIPFGFGITWRWGLDAAFDRSPYRFPIGGRDEELQGTSRDDIMALYRSAYRPDNMTAVIVGDVEPEAALSLLQDTFGRAPGGAGAALLQPPAEAPQSGLRYRLDRGDLAKAYAKLIFHGPSERDPWRPVQSVVKRILADGRSCRLYRTVQEEQQLVSDIAVLTETGPREGIFVVDLETNPEQVADAIRATAAVLEELKNTPPPDDELDKTKRRVERSYVFNTETVQGQSATIGYYDAMQDLEGAFLFPDRVAAVDGKDVSRYCRKIFRRSNVTVLLYLPRQTDLAACSLPADAAGMERLLAAALSDEPRKRRAEPPASSPARATVRGQAATAAAASGQPAEVKVAPATRAGVATWEQTALANGLTTYYRVDRTRPTVALSLYATGGSCRETAASAGLAGLAQQVQVKGTETADAAAIHQAIERLGASVSPRVDRDYGGLYLTSLSRQLAPIIDQLGDIACRPTFPAEELERERRLALDQLQAMADDPFQSAAREMRAVMYGDHPYGRPLLGTEASLPHLSRDELVAHHAESWLPANLTLVVSGDIVPQDLLPRLEDALADLPEGAPPPRPDLAGGKPATGTVERRLTRNIHQSIVFLAWPGPTHPDQDRAELMLLKELLNGQSGRLFEALRNQQSLCYSTGLMSTAGYGQGLLAAYVLTDPASETRARGALLGELMGLLETAVPEEEFARARAKLVGNLLIANQANAARVGRCARDVLYSRGPNNLERLLEEINACTPEAVRTTALRYLDEENHFAVLVGPESG